MVGVKTFMYDKIKLFLQRNSGTPDISSYLDEAKEQTDLRTGEVNVFGSLEGLKVGLYVGGYSIVGSLAKYMYPSNIYPLDRKTTAQAIEKLSDSLHLDLKEADVTGVEFGTQFLMRKPPQVYINKLGDMPRRKRLLCAEGTLYYTGTGRQQRQRQKQVLCFYDKKADAAAKGLIMPQGFERSNLLRYELRLNGRIPHQTGRHTVTASTLSEREFYRKLVSMWEDSYFSISKMNGIKKNVMEEIKSVKDAKDVLFARLLSQSGKDVITDYLEELKQNNVFKDSKYYTRAKNALLDIANNQKAAVSDEDIKELDNEVKNVGAYI